MAASEPFEKELIIRVPKGAVSKNRRHSVLKFNNCSDNVDVTQSTNLQFCREDNEATYMVQADTGPKSGIGSEFGRHLREEARRKRMGFSSAKYSKDSQPWIATLNPDSKQTKKFRGIKEGGVSQNADYWIFVKSSDGSLEAFPVDEWYNFMPIARYKTLDAEEAEEKFLQRNKILNQFALKIREQLQVVDGSNEAPTTTTSKPKDDDDDDPTKVKKKKEKQENEAKISKRATTKSKKKPKLKKPKTEKDEHFIASEDSDDGDEEGREVDYMSDSELSVSSEEGPAEDKARQQLIGVDEEDGMKKLIASDDEEENGEAAEEEDNEGGEKVKKFEQVAKLESLTTAGVDNDGDDTDSGSESDDPDEDVKSPFFMQEKKSAAERATEGEAEDKAGDSSKNNSTSAKRKLNEENGSSSTSKKIKIEKEKSPEGSAGITEDEVRRYLQKKPQSSKELVAKFKPKCQDMSKAEVVKLLADILKRLGPEQIERNGVMYFTLRK